METKVKIFRNTVFFLLCCCLGAPVLHAQSGLSFDGELRMRAEGRDNADFNSERLDGTVFVLNRFRLAVGKQLRDNIKLYAQLQDSRLWGEEGSSLAALNAVDLHQAYLQIGRLFGLPLQLQLGRQQLEFGAGRLVGSYDWHNVGRAFDAAHLRAGGSRQSMSIWLAHLRDFNAPTVSRNQEFAGAYFSTKKWLPGSVDAYAMLFFDERNYDSLTDLSVPIDRSESGSNHLALWTLGTRVQTRLGKGADFELEAAYQTGFRGPLDIRAYGIAAQAGYTLPVRWKPGLHFGYSYGSGDKDPLDTKIETFSNLFPDVHRHFGGMDYASWSNIAAAFVRAGARPGKSLSFSATYHWLALASDGDNWYRGEGYRIGSPGEIYRRAVPGAGRHLGHEIDLRLDYVYRKEVKLSLGASGFFTGEFVTSTGGQRADDSYFAYLAVTAGF